MLQFPAQHTRAGLQVFEFLDPLTLLGQRGVRVLLDFGSKETLGGLQGPFWAMGGRQGGTTTRLSPAVLPLFQRRFMDAKLCSNLRLAFSAF